MISCYEKRVKKGDTSAMVDLGKMLRDGEANCKKDEAKAFELFQMAAALGSANAIGQLGVFLVHERFTSSPNIRKANEYFEDAAKKGDVHSRYSIACLLAEEDNYDLAIKHWHLAAAAGDDESMKRLWECFHVGKLSKPDLEKALRAHKAASDEMNTEERERYDAYKEAQAGNDERLTFIYQSYYDGFINAKELKGALKAYRAGDWRAVEMMLKEKYGLTDSS